MEQSAALGLGLLSTVIVTIMYMLFFPAFFFSLTAAGQKNKNNRKTQANVSFSHTRTFRERKMHLPVHQDIH